MRRGVLLLLVVAAVSIAFGLSEPSAQKLAAAPHPALTRAEVPISGDPVIGPGWGGVGSQLVALPIRFLGTGEQAEDLEVFDARRFAEDLVGAEQPAADG